MQAIECWQMLKTLSSCVKVFVKKRTAMSRKIVNKKLQGGVLLVAFCCAKGHDGVWYSSKILCEKKGQKIFVSSTLLAASTLITGNNHSSISDGFGLEQLIFRQRGWNVQVGLHFVLSLT